jgi:hypothetical protein
MVLAVAALALDRAPVLGRDIGVQGVGFRAGASISPDQFHGGLYLDAGHLFKSLRLQPSLELGVGNGTFLGALNLDAVHLFGRGSRRPYLGGGPALNLIDVYDGVGETEGLTLKPVLNFVGGLELKAAKSRSQRFQSYLLELRLGIGDTPDLKLTAGMML